MVVFALVMALWIALGVLAFFNIIRMGTDGNLEASYSYSFILDLAIIKMVEVLRSETYRLT